MSGSFWNWAFNTFKLPTELKSLVHIGAELLSPVDVRRLEMSHSQLITGTEYGLRPTAARVDVLFRILDNPLVDVVYVGVFPIKCACLEGRKGGNESL